MHNFHPKTSEFLKQDQQLFIDGEWVSASDNSMFESVNPATGEILINLTFAKEVDVNQAVESAQKAFEEGWGTPQEIGELMWKLADLMERDKQVLIELETLDNGKSLNGSDYDVTGAINHFRYYAGWATKIEGASIPVNSVDKLVYTRREALGVVGLIVPWNFPLMITAWKLAPALACGNCCILKPAEQTSLTALYLGKLIQEAGFPAGVVNILTGYGNPTGEAICRHNGVEKVSFTGSTAVGRKIMVAAAESNLKKVSLELGGKSPNVIFDDADLDKVIEGIHWSSFYNSGQECTLGSRVYVQDAVYEKVINKLTENARNLTIGNGLKNPDLGPMISKQQLDRVTGFIEKGQTDGAEAILKGERLEGELANGYFLSPTIFAHQNDELSIVQKEIFGPVVVVSSFKDFDEAIHRANNSIYGLAAAVWTNDINKAHKFAHQAKAGTIWINGYDLFSPAVPFGGYKQSGIGREMGKSAIDLFTQEKAVWVNLD
jgi:aldehyde dehydrogenase (NAD+)/phenylacetaldehyde dehydrogenase